MRQTLKPANIVIADGYEKVVTRQLEKEYFARIRFQGRMRRSRKKLATAWGAVQYGERVAGRARRIEMAARRVLA